MLNREVLPGRQGQVPHDHGRLRDRREHRPLVLRQRRRAADPDPRRRRASTTCALRAGAPLGTETGFECGRLEGQLEQGDRILLYTDGIPEIGLPNGGSFGMRRFAQLFERTREHSLKDATTAILVHAEQASAGQRQADDWTFTMIEWA